MYLKRSLLPDLVCLQAFECAARHENFTQAAKELQLTQSAVSRQIRTLEEQLDIKLFERIRRSVVLTSAARTLLPEISKMLRQAEDVVLQAQATSQHTQMLTIATLPTFGSRWLMPHLSDFIARNDGVAVSVVSRSVPFDFSSENIDIAIHFGQPNWPRAVCTFLRGEEVAPVANPAVAQRWLAEADGPKRPPLLHLATRPHLWSEWFALAGYEANHGRKGNRFDDFNMIIQAAISGMGVALLPLNLIESELAQGRLDIVSDLTMRTSKNYYLVVPEDRQDRAVVKKFRSWLLEQ